MKEYEVLKTVELIFYVKANSELEAEEKVWTLDDNTAIGYYVENVQVLRICDISGEEE